MNNLPIKTHSRHMCPACNSAGSTVYKDLVDKLFSAPGKWDMSKCINTDCSTLWLNPTPNTNDIEKLYTQYSTHTEVQNVIKNNKRGIRKLLDMIRSAYLNVHYNYPTTVNPRLIKPLSFLAYLDPAWRDIQAVNTFYIPYVENGKLLDLGCGNGSSMLVMQNKGWDVTGIDFDEKATNIARRSGLNVYTGDLSSHKFQDEEFDAIMMNHVIEHVSNPKGLLEECYRILKKDGVLVSITPNATSRGSRKYRENWRGLETPQHLQIFTVKSLKKLAQDIGFSNIESFSSVQGDLYILRSSENIKNGINPEYENYKNILSKILKSLKLYWLGLLNISFPNDSEVAVLKCKK